MNPSSGKELTIHEKIKAFRSDAIKLSEKDLNEIKIYLLEYKDTLNHTQFYEGIIKDDKIVSCFSETFQDELVQHIHTKYNATIALIVNLPAREVILSCNSSIISCTKLCTILFGEQYISNKKWFVGTLTPNFLKLTQQLQPCT